jgi:predicted glutamine amidotransferase
MCRLLGYCSQGSTSVAGLIGEDGLRDFTALSAFHADGWGMGWYDADEPRLHKSVRPAVEEPSYGELTHRALGDIGLVHLRWATPGIGLAPRNSHPFRHDKYSFAHNGAIHPQRLLPEMLPPEWEHRITGETDSERYFLHIMSRLEARGGDVIAAIGDTIESISSRYAVNSLNAILLAPERMYAISWHDPARIPADELRRRGVLSTAEEIAGYFHLAYRVTADAVVAASSGWPQPDWEIMPNGSVLVVDRATLKQSLVLLAPAA